MFLSFQVLFEFLSSSFDALLLFQVLFTFFSSSFDELRCFQVPFEFMYFSCSFQVPRFFMFFSSSSCSRSIPEGDGKIRICGTKPQTHLARGIPLYPSDVLLMFLGTGTFDERSNCRWKERPDIPYTGRCSPAAWSIVHPSFSPSDCPASGV